MILTLKTRLAASIAIVVLVMGVGDTIIGARLFGDSLVAQIQRGVEHDFNTARLVYNAHLSEIQTEIEFIAREPSIIEAVGDGRPRNLSMQLARHRQLGGLDVLAVTDAEGFVLSRAAPAPERGDDRSGDQTVRYVMESRASIVGTIVVPGDVLALEAPELADRARIDLLETPHERPPNVDFLADGMMLKAAAPIMAEGKLIGVVYGGVLLNRGEDMVDSVKETAYAGETWQGRDIGTAAIYQGDIRIATSVSAHSGDRAIGTRVSEEIYGRVIGEGERWVGRAFNVEDWYVAAYGPIRDLDERVIGILHVGVLADEFDAMRTRTVWTFAIVSIAGMVAALVVASVLSTGIVRPARDMARASRDLAQGRLDARVKVDPKAARELVELAETFNFMVQSIAERDERLQESARKITESKKLATLGQLAAGIAHEINNPLGGIVMYSHMLKEDLVKAENRENVVKIAHEADRCKAIVKGLLDFARQTKPERTESNINHVLNEMIALLEQQSIFHNISMVKDLSPSIPLVEVDVGQMQEVFMNLVLNAAQAMDGSGTLTAITRLIRDATVVEIEIRDTGPGIPSGKIDKIFEPFYTTKEIGRGTGLGLSIAYGIVERHHGSIHVESEVGRGTSFFVRLPVPEIEPGM